jgi:hypothetical protein
MQKLIFSFFAIMFFTTSCGVVFAAPTCPAAPEMIDLNAKFSEISDTAVLNIEACLSAREQRTESSITDFTCPSGDSNTSSRPHAEEVLAYQLAVATVFATIDKNAMTYAESVQCIRERDPIKWIETNRIVIHGDGTIP